MSYVRISRIASACALTLVISGCGLGSPYVKVPSPTTDAFCGTDGCTLDEALRYSRATRDAYRAVLVGYARLTDGTGAAILGIGAAALGFGVVKAHRDVFTTLGFAGATTYAYSKYYENPPREELFQQTIEALKCAESEAGKLWLAPEMKDEIKRLQRAIVPASTAVGDAAATVTAAAIDLRRELAAAEAAPKPKAKVDILAADDGIKALRSRANSIGPALEAAGAARSAASKAHAAGSTRIGVAEAAGRRLGEAVDSIVVATDREAKKTIPSPDSAFLLVRDLPVFATKFLPDKDAIAALLTQSGSFRAESGLVKAAGAAPTPSSRFDDAMQDLERKIAMLNDEAATLTATIGSSLGADPFERLEACHIAGLADLALEPPTEKLTMGTAKAIAIDASGGKMPYQWHFVGTQPADLLVTGPKSNESRFVLNVPAALVPESYKLAIVDAAGRRATFVLTVEAAAASPGAAGATANAVLPLPVDSPSVGGEAMPPPPVLKAKPKVAPPKPPVR